MKRSTPLTRRTPLRTDVDKTREWQQRSRTKTARKPQRPSFTPASDAQRDKVRGAVSIVSGETPCDPAHLWPRGLGGCDDPLCVVALTRLEHRAFDDGALDVLPYLIARGLWAELAHMVGVHHVDPLAMLQRLTGERYVPVGCQ